MENQLNQNLFKYDDKSFCLINNQAFGPPFSFNNITVNQARTAIRKHPNMGIPKSELGFIIDLAHLRQLLLEIEVYNNNPHNAMNQVNSVRIYKGISDRHEVDREFKETVFIVPANNNAIDLLGVYDIDDNKENLTNFNLIGEARPCPKLC